MAAMPNVNTYQMFVETDKAGYLIRQWIGYNLYDRVSVQPYLADIEKRWIAFQLLTCLRDTRISKIAHGDIKSENVLITSDLTVVLTDFAYAFKPTFLPIDDPSDFSFFFDTSGRRTCYLAPERFETRAQREQRQAEEKRRLEERRIRKQAEAKRKADEKRRGSTVAATATSELLAEATANDVYNLQTGSASNDRGTASAAVVDLDDAEDDLLADYRPSLTEEMDVFSAGCVLAEMWTDGRTVFNLSEMFAYRDGALGLEGVLDNIADPQVRNMISQMLSLDPTHRLKFDRILSDYRGSVFPEYFYTFLQDYITSLSDNGQQAASKVEVSGKDFLKRNAGTAGSRIDRMLAEWESINVHLEDEAASGVALLLLNIITSSLRNCTWSSSRLHGLELFTRLLPHVTDEDKVDRMVPFAVELLRDQMPGVRAAACRVVINIVESVTFISAGNAAFIPEYLLPQMRELVFDPDVSVRATYAECLVRLADTAYNVLQINQVSKAPKSSLDQSDLLEPNYDAILSEIIDLVRDQVTSLLQDPSVPVKTALLASIPRLCVLFGPQLSSDPVLSHIVTYLNARDWRLRLAFFESIVQIGPVIGLRAMDDYILPLMLQSLADPEEAVVCQVIKGLIKLDEDGWVQNLSRWDCFAAIRGFMCHPNTWIRQSAVGYIAVAAKVLPPADVWCILYPNIRPLLKHDIARLDESSLMGALLEPLARAKLVAAKTAALNRRPEAFWLPVKQTGNSKSMLTRSVLNEKLSQAPHLRDKEIGPEDEKKIVAMRDFIFKQAWASKGRQDLDEDTTGGTADAVKLASDLAKDLVIKVVELGVTGQTIMIDDRTVGAGNKSDVKRLRPLLASDRGLESRRTSMAARSSKGVDSPLDEIRRRLHAGEAHSGPSSLAEHYGVDSAATPSEVEVPTTDSLAPMARQRIAKTRLEGKVAPAVGAVRTNALGMTTIHDELASGQTTPLAGQGTSSLHLPGIPGTASYTGSYEGNDPAIRSFLEHMDGETHREPLLDFGPRVSNNVHRKRARSKNNTTSPITLIAHLTQHTGPIVGMFTSPDQAFFVTASTDRTVLVWDAARLERSVSAKARLSYTMPSAVSAMCRIENTHCMAVAAEEGDVHVLRVHVSKGDGGTLKYGRLECIRRWQVDLLDGHVTRMSHLGGSLLLIITNLSVIAVLDIRSMTIKNRYQHPLEMGSITAVYQTTSWAVVGTALGILSLWDLRFGLLLKSWRAGGSITSIDIHPTKGHGSPDQSQGRWIICGVHRKEVVSPIIEVYDVETSDLVEVYEVRSERPSSKTPYTAQAGVSTNIPGRSELVAELAAKRTSVPDYDEDRPAVLSLLTGQRFASLPPPNEGSLLDIRTDETPPQGYLVTAGQDKVIRYFDLANPAEGMIISGSAKQKDVIFRSVQLPLAGRGANATIGLNYTLPRTAERISADPRIQERIKKENTRDTLGGRQPLRPHYDAVCALAVIETGVSSCIISGDRGGIIKVWRIEGNGAGI